MSNRTVINPYRRQVEAQTATPQTPEGIRAPRVRKHASKQEEVLYDETGTFNPQSYPGGSKDQIREALGKPRKNAHRMFNKEGQVNAQSNQDALQQIAYLLQNVTGSPAMKGFYREASAMPSEDRRKVIAAALQDPSGEGFAILGQELLLPIKDIVDYEGWIRKVLRVRPLAQGELFRIAKDVRATAWIVGQDGQSLESRLYGKYVQPSEFKITAYPTVDIEDVYQVNYDILDRAQDTARQEIELEEDKRGVNLLTRAATTMNPLTAIGAALTPATMEAIRFEVEKHRLVVEKYLINRAELSDLVANFGGAAFDPVTTRELLLAGYVGTMHNAQVITAAGTGVEEVVPAGTTFATTGSEYLGEMGIRVELFSEPFNKFSHRESVKGWAFIEIVGFAIVNPRAVAMGQK